MIEGVMPVLRQVQRVSIVLGFGVLGSMLPSSQALAALCPAQLATQLNAALDQAPLDTAYTGLVLQTQGQNPRMLYNRNGDRLFTPASNIKLLTTAAAAHQLG
ncbi:hypothetical protein C8B47_22850, partial [filamentous cyanobacterium CCP4]